MQSESSGVIHSTLDGFDRTKNKDGRRRRQRKEQTKNRWIESLKDERPKHGKSPSECLEQKHQKPRKAGKGTAGIRINTSKGKPTQQNLHGERQRPAIDKSNNLAKANTNTSKAKATKRKPKAKENVNTKGKRDSYNSKDTAKQSHTKTKATTKYKSMSPHKIHPRSCHKSRNNQSHIKRAVATRLQRKTWGVQLGDPSRG